MNFPAPDGGSSVLVHLLWAVGLNGLLGGVAWRMAWVSRSGFVGGVILGSWIIFFGSCPAYLVLLTFFALGTAATRLGYQRKAAGGLAQEEEGRRGARHAVANCGAGWLLVSLFPRNLGPAVGVAYVAAFATALADTLGSEIGQLWGRTTVDPLRWRRVPPGTEGAISLEGSLAGALGAAILGVLGQMVGLYPAPLAWVVVVAAVGGSGLESLVGSLKSPTGKQIDNELLNFSNTVVGALLGWILAQIAL